MQHASVEQAISHSTHRRRRRRRHHGSGGLTHSAARRNSNDLNGDGVLDRLQGTGILNQLDTVRQLSQLGSTLAAINSQAAQLAASASQQQGTQSGMANVALTSVSKPDSITPDDKSFADRAKDKTTNPRNKNKPQIGG